MTVKHPLAFKILVFLEKVPRYLKEGPWSPVAYLVLTSFLGYLLINFENALVSYNQLFDVQSIHYKQNRETGNWIQYYRAFGCLYMLSITCIVLYHSGVAPLASYTLTSWNLVTVRLFSSFIGALGLRISPLFQNIADIVRYPALVGCSITVIIWWSVLVPVIHHFMPDAVSKKKFWLFNTSFPLLNLHLFNLPLCAIEFLATGKCLTYFDFYVALAVVFIYSMFYLNVLDAMGLHIYIILSPRTFLCFIPYGVILFSYLGLLNGWNSILGKVYEFSCH